MSAQETSTKITKPLFNDFGIGPGTADNSIGGQVNQIILTGIALRQFYNASQAENNQKIEEIPDTGVRLQLSADTSQKIPVVYGTAFLGGKLTDVRMTDNNQTMWYCLTLCEVTGTVLSTSTASAFIFKDIYYNNNRVVFNTDGFTIKETVDVNGKIDKSLKDLVEIYCFKNGSNAPAAVEDFPMPTTANANTLFPEWGVTHTMNELAFILVKVKYNKEKNADGLGEVMVKLENSMTEGGDVLYDAMTNTRYGAGIPVTDIKSS
tara:strand:+ start:5340 stop:6131 length:792 start_codon:yes stop_codon:yes gene_type:complete